MIDIDKYIEIYDRPSNFPYHRRGVSHFILLVYDKDTHNRYVRRMFVDKALLRFPWMSSYRKRERLLLYSPLFPYILDYLDRHLLKPHNLAIERIQFGYFERIMPFNFFYLLYHRYQHLWYKWFYKDQFNEFK